MSCIIDFEKIKNKTVFFDTCFIINMAEYQDLQGFANLLGMLYKNNCIPVINKYVYFEYLRSANNISERENREELLSNFIVLPERKISTDLINIANIYSNKKGNLNKQISIVDCTISTQLKLYHKDLVVLTSDLGDFPLLIHDRLGVYPVDVDNSVLLFGFYIFNMKKYKKCLEDFNKSK